MKRICKIVTCGDVDSGKSTLLGRLIYNTNNIKQDQLDDIKNASLKYGNSNQTEWGLLFDGLQEERNQHITIDVAHYYFNIDDIRFHILDCPGHEQYIHNFAIAEKEADIAILMVDATKGLMPQTLKHLFLCEKLQLENIIIAITKIDLVNNDDIDKIKSEITKNTTNLKYTIFETSAMNDIHINELGKYLYDYSLKLTTDLTKFALCIQDVKYFNNERFYQGISYGEINNNDMITVYPSNLNCKINKVENQIDIYKLDNNIDVSRGYIFSNIKFKNDTILNGDFIKFNVQSNLTNLYFRYGTGRYNIKKITDTTIELDQSIYYCNITDLKSLGYGVLVDKDTELNVGLFVIKNNISKLKNHCFWFTGYSGSGKTTLSKKLAEIFPITPIILDGDEIRKNINYDLDLSDNGRDTNVRKIANLANLLLSQGFNVIVACISKDIRQREYAKNLLNDAYVEIFVEASEETRKQRDTKHLYKNNLNVLNNYEKSTWDYVTINTDKNSIEKSVLEMIQKLKNYL